VVLAGAAGATAVYRVGATQRREDRAALLAYERALVPILREGGRLVQEEMKPSLREISEGEITGDTLLGRTAAWRGELERIRARLAALRPPAFLGDIGARWLAAVDAYLAAVDAFEALARAPAGSERARLVAEAAAAGERADRVFDRAAAVIQFHRRRLGLGPSPSLPDPAARRDQAARSSPTPRVRKPAASKAAPT
jgi:hypothetical protein